jgi:predicted phosphodiesterase
VRVALLSDMHGNAVAFRAALADVERVEPDLTVSLGDVAQGGPQPRECVEILRGLGCPCVFGNSDEFLFELDLGQEAGIADEERKRQLLEVGRWSQEQLGEDGIAFLRSFQPTVEVDLDGTRLVCCHATPTSNEDVVLPATPPDEIPVAGDVVAAGHVHLQWLRRVRGTLWLCAGSVGLVYEHREPMAEAPFLPYSEYAVLTAAAGRVDVEFRRIGFDVEALLAAARDAGLPDVDRWAPMWRR